MLKNTFNYTSALTNAAPGFPYKLTLLTPGIKDNWNRAAAVKSLANDFRPQKQGFTFKTQNSQCG